MKRFICFLLTGLALALHTRSQTYPLEIAHLSGDFYVYTTYKLYDGKPFPSNGLYVVTDSGVVLMDTPWDPDVTLPLLDSIKNRHNKEVVMSLSTHFHADRTAGLDILRANNVRTWSSRQTYALCKQKGEKMASYTFTKDTSFKVGNVVFETFYPGPGHTSDNIVVWFPGEKILYGGCFVKSMEAKTLGNMEDASVTQWPVSMRKLMAKYPRPRFVIPGHQAWNTVKSLKHTLDLADKANQPK